MTSSGSGKRRRDKEVLVRLDEAQYERLTKEPGRLSRAEYLRQRIGQDAVVTTAPDLGQTITLTSSDRKLLSEMLGSMGRLAGMMKRAVFEMPSLSRPTAIQDLLNRHHADLQEVQGELRSLLRRLS